jgi:hypothetical protein
MGGLAKYWVLMRISRDDIKAHAIDQEQCDAASWLEGERVGNSNDSQ